MKTFKLFALLAVVLFVFLAGCRKEESEITGKTPVRVFLTDAPGNFQQVNVDIIGVEFKINDGGVVVLSITPGIYNLLDFTNGADTLIATGDVPSGTLSQIRLVLGPNNSVMVDSVVYPLSTPSAMQSGLKLNVHSALISGVTYSLLLDFDANQSIVLTGNGTYLLKPVIRVINNATSGSMHGHVTPMQALPTTISAVALIDTFSTVTNADGYFLLQGLPSGLYTVTITPQAPYLEDTMTNVGVSIGQLTELGEIAF